jgi:P-type conjugative transfer protein TrbG
MRKQICSVAVTVTVFVSSLVGQSPATPPSGPAAPVQAKRVPGQTPPKASNQPSAVLQSYDFGDQLRVLQDPTAMDSQKSASMPAGANAAPKGYQPRSDIPLSSTAIEAVRVSETWRGGQNTPAAGSDGRVLYAYGAGLPIVVCAPLRVCIIELQPGERITGEPQIGDSVRWNISPAEYGQGEESTSVIVLKPLEPGLDTNLLVTTDRRAYYLRLVSKPQEYVARVAFSYPDEDNGQKWQQHMLEQRVEAQQNKRDATLMPALIAADKLNFSYKVTGGNDQLRPVRVFDDGAKTYIQMPPEVQHREAPVLVVLGSDGKGEMTNYRVQEQTYVVDRLFERAQLILGVGKKAQKVEITREQQPKG